MKGAKGEVLYVGKAINLRQRVKQYFAGGGDGRAMVPFLVQQIVTIDTIVVRSEKEALLVENTFIKQHKPKYNAMLKDDKTYIALKVNIKHLWPMVQVVRFKGRPKGDDLYFGPYVSAYAARQTLDLLQKLFPLRQCSDQELARRDRPCILYDMKRCVAPCVEKCTKEEYAGLVKSTVRFLRGQDETIMKKIEEARDQAAEKLEFEEAAAYQRLFFQIETTLERQRVENAIGHDADVIGLYRQGDEVTLSRLIFREGKLMGAFEHSFSKIADDDQAVVENFLVQFYTEEKELPREIFIPFPLSSAVQEVLGVKITVPQKGEKKALVEMAILNAKTIFNRAKDASVIVERTLLEMEEKLRLTHFPERIECFDNSNFGGGDPVSALVAFTNGVRDKARTRKYKIKKADFSDDYGAMREALRRRYSRTKEEDDLPDLLIVDGGKGHLNVALAILEELDIATIDVIGVAKDEARHDKGVTQELIFLPHIKDPILLLKHSPVLFLLQKIRDEAHQVAISFQRKRRSQALIKSALSAIPGIGPLKQKALLRHFGSLKKVLEASPEALRELKGIGPTHVKSIQSFGNQNEKAKKGPEG